MIATNITVLVPYFNARDHIANAVATIGAQTCPPDHALFYDDGSTDDSHAYVDTLLKENLAPLGIGYSNVRGDRNRGRGYARQHLVEMADTELVSWLDADDTWHPFKLQSQMLFLASCKNLDKTLVFGNYKVFEKMTGVARTVKMPRRIDLNLIFGFGNVPRSLQLQTTLGKRRAFFSTGFDASLNWSEDHDFAVRFLAEGGALINSCTRSEFTVAQYNRSIPKNWQEIQRTHAQLLEKHTPIIRDLGLSEQELGLYKELKYVARIYAASERADQLKDLIVRASPFRQDPRFSQHYEKCVAMLESLITPLK